MTGKNRDRRPVTHWFVPKNFHVLIGSHPGKDRCFIQVLHHPITKVPLFNEWTIPAILAISWTLGFRQMRGIPVIWGWLGICIPSLVRSPFVQTLN
jgi:hypothetical protein